QARVGRLRFGAAFLLVRLIGLGLLAARAGSCRLGGPRRPGARRGGAILRLARRFAGSVVRGRRWIGRRGGLARGAGGGLRRPALLARRTLTAPLRACTLLGLGGLVDDRRLRPIQVAA